LSRVRVDQLFEFVKLFLRQAGGPAQAGQDPSQS
jgi:hypothetical protein